MLVGIDVWREASFIDTYSLFYDDNEGLKLEYTRDSIFNEPFKMIPLISKKGMKNVTSYGLIEVPVPPIAIISSDSVKVEE